MNSRIEKEELLKPKVFGKYADSYYGALNLQNPILNTPKVITGIIDTTVYNRVPTLIEKLFSWINEVNAKPSLLDAPLEVVIIGVGNTAYRTSSSYDVYNHSSPQVIEILVALSAIKNHKINLTLIDRNKKSLEMAADLNFYDINPYFQDSDLKLCQQLKTCFENVCITDESGQSYKIEKSKLNHIKVNSFCADIAEVTFPMNRADALITTYTLQYVKQEKIGDVLCGITNSLKPHGRMITTDHYGLYQPIFYAVSKLPEDKVCEKDIIYLNFDGKKESLNYCFLSQKEAKVITNHMCLNAKDFAELQHNIKLDKNPQDLAPVDIKKILKLINYAKHNVLMTQYSYHSNRSQIQKVNSALFFSSKLQNNFSNFSHQFNEAKRMSESDVFEVTAHKKMRYGRFSEY